LGVGRFFLNTPSAFISVKEWIDKNHERFKCQFILLEPSVNIVERPPIVSGHHISARFTRNYERKTTDAFVAIIPDSSVLGAFSNIIIAPDNQILSDVSREFGAEGGRKPQDFSIFHSRLRMPRKQKLMGKVAVISTSGANNFHHWNFDVLPRLYLLKRAGILNSVDKFIISNNGLKFQKEGLAKFDIDPERIINPIRNPNYFAGAEQLYIPSLPEDLGTISPWVIRFLRDTFLGKRVNMQKNKLLFLSRKNAPTRRIVNHVAVSEEIFRRGFLEFTPEDYTIEEVAAYFSNAEAIVSVHGSGLSNLPFVEEGAKVLDIMAPFHQDPYYWMICNQRKAKYVALFSEGEHPSDDLDLVKRKVDSDLIIDLDKLKHALDLIL
jgi:capsular polysaccharide biosynthesis protein